MYVACLDRHVICKWIVTTLVLKIWLMFYFKYKWCNYVYLKSKLTPYVSVIVWDNYILVIFYICKGSNSKPILCHKYLSMDEKTKI